MTDITRLVLGIGIVWFLTLVINPAPLLLDGVTFFESFTGIDMEPVRAAIEFTFRGPLTDAIEALIEELQESFDTASSAVENNSSA